MNSYLETLDWIYNLRGGVIDLRLDRMDQALGLFDHPERQFPSLHIAGTNGKGSTAAMLHRILTVAGYRTGLYTSPHLVSFTERIRVGDEEISPDDVVALAREIRDRTSAAGVMLTFFEIVTVMAFVYLARQRIDIGVIEVGLGGRLDATNLVQPIVTMITTISMDHEAYLGSDLLSIGKEKAGIIKPRIPVICGPLPREVVAMVKQVAGEKSCAAYFLGSDFGFFLKDDGFFDYKGIKHDFSNLAVALRGRHQRSNAAIAVAALELAGEFPVDERAIRHGLQSVAWPGRFEIVRESPWVVLDGAHNGEGAKALAETLDEFRRGGRVKILFAAMEDKDWRQMLSVLLPRADELVLTRVAMDRSADPDMIARWLPGSVPYRVAGDACSGLRLLYDGAASNDTIVVAGSLYLLGEIRPSALELAKMT